MRWRFEGTAEALHSPIPWVALSAALALAAAGWFALEHSRHDEARSQFERRTETAEAAIRSRMVAHEQILRSGAARIASSANINRLEWRDFIARLQLDERFPGVQSIGYAERSKGADGDTFPIVFNEPPTGSNTSAIGFDISSDPVRRQAMLRARDTNNVAISAKIVLAGDAFRGSQAQQPGFQMFIPVFRHEARALTAAERDTELAGYVLGSFRMYDLMRGVLDEGVLQVLDMRVFDSADAKPDSELIDTRNAWRATPTTERRPIFSRQVTFQMPSRMWTIQFISRPEFDAALDEAKPWGVMWAASSPAPLPSSS